MVSLTAGQKVLIQGHRSPEGSSVVISESEGTISINEDRLIKLTIGSPNGGPMISTYI